MTLVEYVCPVCVVCGKQETLTVELEAVSRWRAGALVQRAFPNLSDSERELLMTGTHDDCWSQLVEPDS